MSYKHNLIIEVLNNSNSQKWEEAVLEWEVIDWDEGEYEDVHCCICGKQHLINLFTIQNIINQNILKPIGSQCIKKFDRKELSDEVNSLDKMFSLQKAYNSGDGYIKLNSDLFSRKSLRYMYDHGAFKPSKYGSAEDSFNFMLDMFNKRSAPSVNQQKKIRAIIMNDIRPYCHKLMVEKEKN